ncbi:MAG TPA: ABC transporter ATP-binding protein [Oligoflexia bacterium]|nr:ABC transporter ATP-binding protein [Oligoflexia bacterium]HMR24014.1 ABC transporter ATP-binding protein [Oligoflexia bacterium]
MSYLDLKNIYLNYKDFSALKDINLSLNKGEYTLFLGPNGSGKSSLFSIMTSSRKPSTGEIRVEKQLMSSKNIQNYRSNIGVCFQSPSLDPLLTVEENLICHARMFNLNKGTMQKKISELIDYFQLEAKVDQAVSKLSGGMQRKVELIKALLPNVECLFLDEPSTGLDPSARRDLWSFLKKIKQKGIGICMTSHIIEDIDEVDQCYFLKDGQVFLNGNPKDLIAKMGQQLLDIKSKNCEQTYTALKDIYDNKQTYIHDQSIFILNQSSQALQQLDRLNLPDVQSISLRTTNLMDVYHYMLRDMG